MLFRAKLTYPAPSSLPDPETFYKQKPLENVQKTSMQFDVYRETEQRSNQASFVISSKLSERRLKDRNKFIDQSLGH
jgi:hypothetical protein